MRPRAQAGVEFALTIPLLLLVLVAVIDLSRLLFTYMSLVDGTRELARTAAIGPSTSAAAVGAFNNYTVIGGSINPATDQIVVTVADASCAGNQGQGIACVPGSISSVTCSLPLQSTCALPSRFSAGGGYIQVDVTYTFSFNPLFSNGLAGVVDASFMRPVSVLSTSARSIVE